MNLSFKMLKKSSGVVSCSHNMFNKIKREYYNNATVYMSKQYQFFETGYQTLATLAKLQ